MTTSSTSVHAAWAAVAAVAAVAVACSSTTTPSSDAGAVEAGVDAAAPTPDASVPDTAAPVDAAVPTDATADAPVDAPVDAAPDGGACITGGAPVAATGTGTCADPYVVDLTGVALGTVSVHTATGGADEPGGRGGPAACTALAAGTARDIVYHVRMPAAVVSLTLAAEGASADPRIGVHEDPSCGQPINACADAAGAGVCEPLTAPRSGAGFFGATTYVRISEATDSGQPITVRFRPN